MTFDDEERELFEKARKAVRSGKPELLARFLLGKDEECEECGCSITVRCEHLDCREHKDWTARE